MFHWISWNPPREIFYLPLIRHPITWYGAILALGCLVGYAIVSSLYRHYLLHKLSNAASSEPVVDLQVKEFCEAISIYCLVGIVMGARMGHILFYENIHEYVRYPLRIFMIWEGGISSHGAIVGAAIAICCYLYRLGNKSCISFAPMADLLVIPITLGMAFVRLGNFINQEAVGVYTTLPWAIIFESPLAIDGAIPRHPVQLYEAASYVGLFYFLRKLYQKNLFALSPGKIASLFLLVGFTIRFFLEYLKEEPLRYLHLNIGQWLSIPFIIIGSVIFLYQGKALLAKGE